MTTATLRRRWFQFSLKGLMLLVVVVAVPCGWLKWKIDRKSEEREVVAEIQKLGGSVTYAWESSQWYIFNVRRRRSDTSPPGASWLHAMFGDDFLTNVECVHLPPPKDVFLRKWTLYLWAGHQYTEGTAATDSDLIVLATLRSLEELHLPFTNIGDLGVAHCKYLTNLRLLNLEYTNVTDIGLSHLQSLSGLHELSLANTLVTDNGLRYLRQMTQLTHLSLQGTRTTDAGIAELQKALPNCEIIR